MNYYFIKKYIDLLTKEDIINFSRKENIILSDNEVDIIYNTIKYRYNEILNNGIYVINSIKNNISNNTYLKLIELYNKYKKRLEI